MIATRITIIIRLAPWLAPSALIGPAQVPHSRFCRRRCGLIGWLPPCMQCHSIRSAINREGMPCWKADTICISSDPFHHTLHGTPSSAYNTSKSKRCAREFATAKGARLAKCHKTATEEVGCRGLKAHWCEHEASNNWPGQQQRSACNAQWRKKARRC